MQLRLSTQALNGSLNIAKLEADFLNGSNWDITNGNNNALITGLANPTNARDAVNKQYVDGLVDASLKAPEAYDASVNVYPTTYDGNTIQAGDSWRITNAGTMGTRVVNVEDLLIALVDGATNDADFMAAESNRTQATETVLGLSKIATQVIADAGTNDTDYITPLKLSTYISNLEIDKIAGAGMTETSGTFDVIAADLSLSVAADNMQVNIGNTNGTSLEVSATGLELPATVTGARTFNVGAGNNFAITADADLSTLSSQPTGTVDLAVATTKYVNDAIGGAVSVEELTVADDTSVTLTAGDTTSTIMRVYQNGNKLISTEFTVADNGTYRTITEAGTADFSNGDVIEVEYIA